MVSFGGSLLKLFLDSIQTSSLYFIGSISKKGPSVEFQEFGFELVSLFPVGLVSPDSVSKPIYLKRVKERRIFSLSTLSLGGGETFSVFFFFFFPFDWMGCLDFFIQFDHAEAVKK